MVPFALMARTHISKVLPDFREVIHDFKRKFVMCTESMLFRTRAEKITILGYHISPNFAVIPRRSKPDVRCSGVCSCIFCIFEFFIIYYG